MNTIKVSGSYTVVGGGSVTVTVPADATPEQMQDALDAQAGYISLCHECGHLISDAALEDLSEIIADGVTYTRDSGGQWIKWTEK